VGWPWWCTVRAGLVVVDGDDALHGWIAMELFLAGFAIGICRCRSGPRRGVSLIREFYTVQRTMLPSTPCKYISTINELQ
jgi:hypothetical protein